ncbi:MAG: VOC family protein [Promicromonosporaceae bacterium]|nr:VOC family protein [Promicromonosporaceae bacterium]
MSATLRSTAITTRDIAATKDFYLKHLGATVVMDMGWHLALDLGGTPLAFNEPGYSGAPEAFEGGGVALYIHVPDVDAKHAELVAASLTPEGAPKDEPWGSRAFVIRDPNGIALYVHSDIEPTTE